MDRVLTILLAGGKGTRLDPLTSRPGARVGVDPEEGRRRVAACVPKGAVVEPG